MEKLRTVCGSRETLRNILIVFAAFVTLVGCGTLPIPSVVLEGTTITIPVAGGFHTGFGRVLSQYMINNYSGGPITALPTTSDVPYVATSPLEDIQRGELVLKLIAKNGAFISYLPVRAITRVYTDESAVTPKSNGQDMAYVDIPKGVVSASLGAGNTGDDQYEFSIETSLRRRTRSGAYPFDDVLTRTAGGQPWVGWGGATGNEGIPIRIYPSQADAAFADFNGWDVWQGSYNSDNFEDEVAGFYPLPTWNLRIANPSGDVPAAWEVEIYYRRTRFKIVGLSSHAPRRTELIGMLRPDPEALNEDANGCYSGTQTWGTVKLIAVEPAQERAKAGSYFLVLEPRPLECGVALASPYDFTIKAFSLKVFDEQGVDVTDQDWTLYLGPWIF